MKRASVFGADYSRIQGIPWGLQLLVAVLSLMGVLGFILAARGELVATIVALAVTTMTSLVLNSVRQRAVWMNETSIQIRSTLGFRTWGIGEVEALHLSPHGGEFAVRTADEVAMMALGTVSVMSERSVRRFVARVTHASHGFAEVLEVSNDAPEIGGRSVVDMEYCVEGFGRLLLRPIVLAGNLIILAVAISRA